jgi:hypothetical protein
MKELLDKELGNFSSFKRVSAGHGRLAQLAGLPPMVCDTVSAVAVSSANWQPSTPV